MPLGIGAPELIIALVVILIVFGTGKLTGLGGELGRAFRDFRSAVSSKEKRDDDPPGTGPAADRKEV